MRRIEEKLRKALNRREADRFLRVVGMTNQCPWCRQCMQRFDDTTMEDWLPGIAPFDKFTCGNCGGTSLWEFAPVWLFRGALKSPPNPEPVHTSILALAAKT